MGRTAVRRDYGGVSASDRQAERRRKLLDAGRQLWGGSGIGEVTVRGVCGQAGLVPRYFYEQFSDRDALLAAVTDQVYDELIGALLSAGLSEPGDIRKKLRAALKAFLDMISEDPFVHRISIDVMTGAGPLAESRRKALDVVTELVLNHGPDLLDPTSTPTPGEMRRSALFIVGGVAQLIDAWVLDPRESTAELAKVCTEFSLAIVRAAPSAD